jgi:cytochrome c-type biogenesis protein CcmH
VALIRFLTPALCLLIPLFALGLYLRIGQPGLPAAPFVARSAPGRRPPPRRATLAEAIAAPRRRLAAQPDDPEALSALGEALTHEADGVVTPTAQDAFRRALQKNPTIRARCSISASPRRRRRQPGGARSAGALEQRSPADAPWLPTLRAEMERVARAAGLCRAAQPRTPAPHAARRPAGPTPEQVQAMQGLTPEQRQQAIRGMVEGLERAAARAGPGQARGPRRLAAARQRAQGAGRERQGGRGLCQGRRDRRARAAAARRLGRGACPPAHSPAPRRPDAVAVLERLEKAEPRNALALFYLGAADFARATSRGRAALEDAAGAAARRRPDPRDAGSQNKGNRVTDGRGRRGGPAALQERSDEGARARTVQKG